MTSIDVMEQLAMERPEAATNTHSIFDEAARGELLGSIVNGSSDMKAESDPHYPFGSRRTPVLAVTAVAAVLTAGLLFVTAGTAPSSAAIVAKVTSVVKNEIAVSREIENLPGDPKGGIVTQNWSYVATPHEFRSVTLSGSGVPASENGEYTKAGKVYQYSVDFSHKLYWILAVHTSPSVHLIPPGVATCDPSEIVSLLQAGHFKASTKHEIVNGVTTIRLTSTIPPKGTTVMWVNSMNYQVVRCDSHSQLGHDEINAKWLEPTKKNLQLLGPSIPAGLKRVPAPSFPGQVNG